jgi:hypothetical protein
MNGSSRIGCRKHLILADYTWASCLKPGNGTDGNGCPKVLQRIGYMEPAVSPGYNYYFILGDAARGADYMAAAAKLPGGPSYLPGLASRMYAEASSPEVALQLLRALWLQTQDQEMRDVLENRAKEIIIERDVQALEAARDAYRDKHGRLPKTLNDLVISGEAPI